MLRTNPKPWILPTIVFSQFCCTSLWFAGNGVMADLIQYFQLNADVLGPLTSAVQLGFITGTLLFALLTIADRFAPSRVFALCAFLGALANLATAWDQNTLKSLLALRFSTGFFLAGIYPVGMKIAADYYEKGLGKSLGFLVGALVLGTAFPHLLKGLDWGFPWQYVLFVTSGLASLGGLLMVFLVPNGPYRKPSSKLKLATMFQVFDQKAFRAAAFGYFGHMWELYAFWAFVPVMLRSYLASPGSQPINASLWAFLIIGVGGPACFLSGYLSLSWGAKATAGRALMASGLCGLLYPFLFAYAPLLLFLLYLLIWGMVVIADSPMFSTLVAQTAPSENKGTALTIVNCLGFALTIGSIQLLNYLQGDWEPGWLYYPLLLGPIFGLWALYSGSSQQSLRPKA